MKKWLLVCSIDGIDVDYNTVIYSELEPGFWDCYNIAEANGCSFFTIEEV